MPLAPPETIPVESHRVACDGGGALGHPLVYLELNDEGRAVCPYCSRQFSLVREDKVEQGPA